MAGNSEIRWENVAVAREPSRWRVWYLLSAALIIVGAALIPGAILIQASTLLGPPAGSPTFMAPGETTMTLSGPADYAFWSESRSIVDGSYRSIPSGDKPPNVQSTITGEGGERVPVEMKERAMMHLGLIERRMQGRFKIDKTGRYTVKATPASADPVLLSITEAPDADRLMLLTVVIVASVLALVLVAGGSLLFLVTIVRHVRSVRTR